MSDYRFEVPEEDHPSNPENPIEISDDIEVEDVNMENVPEDVNMDEYNPLNTDFSIAEFNNDEEILPEDDYSNHEFGVSADSSQNINDVIDSIDFEKVNHDHEIYNVDDTNNEEIKNENIEDGVDAHHEIAHPVHVHGDIDEHTHEGKVHDNNIRGFIQQSNGDANGNVHEIIDEEDYPEDGIPDYGISVPEYEVDHADEHALDIQDEHVQDVVEFKDADVGQDANSDEPGEYNQDVHKIGVPHIEEASEDPKETYVEGAESSQSIPESLPQQAQEKYIQSPESIPEDNVETSVPESSVPDNSAQTIPEQVQDISQSVKLLADLVEDLTEHAKEVSGVPSVEATDEPVISINSPPIPEDDPNATFLGFPTHQFATPLKSLPALKDIDIISTPKLFSVAKDSSFSPPEVTNDTITAISTYLSLDEQAVSGLPLNILHSLQARSSEHQQLLSETSFLRLRNEQNAQSNNKLVTELKAKLNNLTKRESNFESQLNVFQQKSIANETLVSELTESNKSFASKLEAKSAIEQKLLLENLQLEQEYDEKVVKLTESINEFTRQNIEQSTRINEITKELNNETNQSFNIKLTLTKVNNEVSYLKNQKTWYESELLAVQDRYTDLIKKHELEHLLTSNKLSSLEAMNSTLQAKNTANASVVAGLREKLRAESDKAATLSRDFSNERGSLLQQIQNQGDLINLTKSQVIQRSERITQLETYSSELKNNLGGQVDELEKSLATKNERIIELEEKLLRTEEVLDEELHRESALPRLTPSLTLIAAQGISLLTLYSEFNHLKKQVVLERSQKEKLALQLESFVNELESKKPAIANYRDQVVFYEKSLQDMVLTVESVRVEKSNAEKDSKRLRSRILENENELVSMKRLLKDVGRQLCYFLIHSKIRDGEEDPLTLSEKKAIEGILEKTGNFEDELESDSDLLVTERLLEFKNIAELRHRNEELLKTVRFLTRQSEERERSSVESVAIEEAKDAILTLEGEVERLGTQLVVARETNKLDNAVVVESNAVAVNNASANDLTNTETALRELQASSTSAIAELNQKLHSAINAKNEISNELSASRHQAELTNSRFQNAQSSLDLLRSEISQLQGNLTFWQEQASKQEALLVSKSNELRESEATVSQQRISINSLESTQNYNASLQKSLHEEVLQLKQDKNNLNEFVVNLQVLLKERDESSKDVSIRLDRSIENYQSLQDKLNEKDERIGILTRQAELTLKAQNSKLEQIGEVSKKLLDTKSKLAERENSITALNNKVKELNVKLVSRSSGDVTQDLTEIGQVKQDLQMAEAQVVELQALAEAGEEALKNAANSFDRHKQDLTNKVDLLVEEKRALSEQVDELRQAVSLSKEELHTAEKLHFVEFNKLQTKMDEYYNKANAYDKLQKDYETRINSVRADLSAQVQLSSDSQAKYHQELLKNNELSQSLVTSKNEIELYKEKLQVVNNELQAVISKEESIHQERAILEEQLTSVRSQVSELKEQNGIVLNQLELSEREATSENAGEEDLTKVLAYLRREKEAAEVKLSVKINEYDLVNQKLAQTTSELNRVQSELSFGKESNDLSVSQSLSDKLGEHLQQLNILRESNITLRNESNERLQRIQNLESQLSLASAQLDPLKSRNTALVTDVELSQQRVRLVEEENSRLRSRVEGALESVKLARKEAADEAVSGSSTPVHIAEESGAIKEESANEALIAQMKQKYNDLRNKANSKIQSQNDRFKESQELVASLTEQIAQLKAHETETSKTLKDQIAKLTQEKNALVIQLGQLKKLGELSIEQVTKLEQTVSKIKQDSAKEKQSLEVRLRILDEKLKLDKPDAKGKKLDAAEITKLKEGFTKTLENERQQVKKQVEKLYDMKMKMLNKKVERLEKEARKGTNSNVPVTSAPNAKVPNSVPLTAGISSTTNGIPNTPGTAAVLPATPGFGSTGTGGAISNPTIPTNPALSQKLGYPFTESTLTVHRAGEEIPGQKRPQNDVKGNGNQGKAKRTKDA